MPNDAEIPTETTEDLIPRFILDVAPEKTERLMPFYSANFATPAVPNFVTGMQAEVSRGIEIDLIQSMPKHFSDSVKAMIMLAHYNTTHALASENQASYSQVKDKPLTDPHLAGARIKYERGLAYSGEILPVVLDLRAKSAELFKRTELSLNLSEDAQKGLMDLYAAIAEHQTDRDFVGPTRSTAKVKQLDIPRGSGGLNGMIISQKTDFATFGNGEYAVTKRSKRVIDVSSMPEKWRSALRKAVSHMRPGDDINMLLQLENPDSPGDVLADVCGDEPWVYEFVTTVFCYDLEDNLEVKNAMAAKRLQWDQNSTMYDNFVEKNGTIPGLSDLERS